MEDITDFVHISQLATRIESLIDNVELSEVLRVHLPFILLKLESTDKEVQAMAIKTCKYLQGKNCWSNLPAIKLLELFKQKSEMKLLRHFILIFLRMYVRNMQKPWDDFFFELLHGVSSTAKASSSSSGIKWCQASQYFNIILHAITIYPFPPPGTAQDNDISGRIELSNADEAYLQFWFSRLMLFKPSHRLTRSGKLGVSLALTCAGLNRDEYQFLNCPEIKDAWYPAYGGLDIAKTQIAIIDLVKLSRFTDGDRARLGILASTNENPIIWEFGNWMLRRNIRNFDELDTRHFADLFSLYFLPNLRLIVKVKICDLLTKSNRSGQFQGYILSMLEEFFNHLSHENHPDSIQSLESLRLSLVKFLNHIIKQSMDCQIEPVADKIIEYLKQFITLDHEGILPRNNHLRSLVYQTVGQIILVCNTCKPCLLEWLFESLHLENSHKAIIKSISDALIRCIPLFTTMPDDAKVEIRGILLKLFFTEPKTFTRTSIYIALRYINQCFYFSDIYARLMNVFSISLCVEAPEITEEAVRGSHPHWGRINSILTIPTVNELNISHANMKYEFPKFKTLTWLIFGAHENKDHVKIFLNKLINTHEMCNLVIERVKIFQSRYPYSMSLALHLCTSLFINEGLKSCGISVLVDTNWTARLKSLVLWDENARKSLAKFLQTLLMEDNNLRKSKATLGRRYATQLLLRASFESMLHNIPIIGVDDTSGIFNLMCSLYRESLNFIQITSNDVEKIRIVILNAADGPREKARIFAEAFGRLSTLKNPPLLSLYKSEFINLLNQEMKINQYPLENSGWLMITLAEYFARSIHRNTQEWKCELQNFLLNLLQIIQQNIPSSPPPQRVIMDQALESLNLLCSYNVINDELIHEIMPVEKLMEIIRHLGCQGFEMAIETMGRLGMILTSGENLVKSNEYLTKIFRIYENWAQSSPQANPLYTCGESLSYLTGKWNSQLLTMSREYWNEYQIGPCEHVVENIVNYVINLYLEKDEISLRRAGATWLMTLVQLCGHMHCIIRMASIIQLTMIKGLLDDNLHETYISETFIQGLVFLYENVQDKPHEKDQLTICLKSILQVNHDPGPVNLNIDHDPFNSLSQNLYHQIKAHSYENFPGKLAGLREVLIISQEIQNNELLTDYLSLAASRTFWETSGIINRRVPWMKEIILGSSGIKSLECDKLVGRLYRGRHDTNLFRQKATEEVWKLIVPDSTSIMTQKFELIFGYLIQEYSSHPQTSIQESCLNALIELVNSPTYDRSIPYLLESWNIAFTALQDPVQNITHKGNKLITCLTNKLMKLVSTSSGSIWLLNHHHPDQIWDKPGRLVQYLMSSKLMETKDSRVFAVACGTLVKIVNGWQSVNFLSLIPTLIMLMIKCLGRPDVPGRKLDELPLIEYAKNGESSHYRNFFDDSPIAKAILRCVKLLHIQTMGQEMVNLLVERLNLDIQSGEKLAIWLVIISLVRWYGDKFGEQANELVSIMLKLAIHHNDQSVGQLYVLAIGEISPFVSDFNTRSIVSTVQKLYFQNRRMDAAELLSRVLYGLPRPATTLSDLIVPISYVGKFDHDKQVSFIFNGIWERFCGDLHNLIVHLEALCVIIYDALYSNLHQFEQAGLRALIRLVDSFSLVEFSVNAKLAQFLSQSASTVEIIHRYQPLLNLANSALLAPFDLNKELLLPTLPILLGFTREARCDSWPIKRQTMEIYDLIRRPRYWSECVNVTHFVYDLVVREMQRSQSSMRIYTLSSFSPVFYAFPSDSLAPLVMECVDSILSQFIQNPSSLSTWGSPDDNHNHISSLTQQNPPPPSSDDETDDQDKFTLPLTFSQKIRIKPTMVIRACFHAMTSIFNPNVIESTQLPSLLKRYLHWCYRVVGPCTTYLMLATREAVYESMRTVFQFLSKSSKSMLISLTKNSYSENFENTVFPMKMILELFHLDANVCEDMTELPPSDQLSKPPCDVDLTVKNNWEYLTIPDDVPPRYKAKNPDLDTSAYFGTEYYPEILRRCLARALNAMSRIPWPQDCEIPRILFGSSIRLMIDMEPSVDVRLPLMDCLNRLHGKISNQSI